jgi:predicted phage tail protein
MERSLTRFAESLAGHKGRRFSQIVLTAAQDVMKAQAQYDKVKQGYNDTQENIQLYNMNTQYRQYGE